MDSNILIDENDLVLAQTLSKSIVDTEIRNKAVANILGIEIASKYFDPEVYNIDTDSLCKIPQLNEEFDISDIYVNDVYTDVRIYFDDDELSVPKSHFELGILPEVYMFIKLSHDLSEGIVTGFITPNNIDTSNLQNNCYYLKEKALNSIYDVESRFNNPLDIAEISDYEIYSYLDGTLDDVTKTEFIKKLISSKISRRNFTKIAKAQEILKKVSEYDIGSIGKNNELNENIDELFNANNQKDAEKELLDSFEYTTEVTPSSSELFEEINNETTSFNESVTKDELIQEDVANVEEIETVKVAETNIESETEVETDLSEYTEEEEENGDIDSLFAEENNNKNIEEDSVLPNEKKHSLMFLQILALVLILCGGGCYWWYFNNSQNSSDRDLLNTVPAVSNDELQSEPAISASSPMPNETVNTKTDANLNNTEAGNSVSVPEFERNLDASVLVSNLKVDWEVPSSYVSNAYARRYLIKLGKIIQLNLKTELLLLSKPPISNKITVEIKYNNVSGRFEPVSIVDTSGEKTVDNTIMNTVDTALKMNISTNIEAFGKLQGNPVLIIHL